VSNAYPYEPEDARSRDCGVQRLGGLCAARTFGSARIAHAALWDVVSVRRNLRGSTICSRGIPRAEKRGQTLAQMAIAWVLRDPSATSALVGARTVEQLADTLENLEKASFQL
jgi:aryl-alcohol dehydrogenase-like predicted oxidoreductase